MNKIMILGRGNGGQRGIRTLDTVARIHAFQACAFNQSATRPFYAVNAEAERRERRDIYR